MSDALQSLYAALADRYRIERELGAGGMATMLAAESRSSADVAKATSDLRECRISNGIPVAARSGRHFSDISRAVASATSVR